MKLLAISIAVLGGMICSYCRIAPLVEQPDLSAGRSSEEYATEERRDSCHPSRDESNLRDKVRRLELGRDFCRRVDGYTTRFQKQEVVGTELLDEQSMTMKCRHNPYSIYLQWHTGDTGREVIYIDGQNQNRLIAHDGGWKVRLPAMSLATDSFLALRDARYPVTTAGFLSLIESMLEVHHEDLNQSNFESCTIDSDQKFDGRPCHVFTTIYKSRQDSPTYRKSITYIDCEWNVPVSTHHFGWPSKTTAESEVAIDQATLLESYSFTNVDLHHPLTDDDFDRHNKSYQFH